MEYLLALSILGNVIMPLVLTYFHQSEKKNLHDRLMAKSPDEYIYNTEVAPAEAESLRKAFLEEQMEKPADTPESKKQQAIGRRY